MHPRSHLLAEARAQFRARLFVTLACIVLALVVGAFVVREVFA